MAFCMHCGARIDEPAPPDCPACGRPLPSSPVTPVGPSGPAAPPGTCPNCRTPMTRSGELQFRVGGHSGGSGFLLGNWNQLAEQLQPFSVYHCPTCGRVDLYEPGR